MVEELTAAIKSEVQIIKMMRVTRMFEGTRMPTQGVKIWFKDLDLSETVKIYEYYKKEVQHFIELGRCFRCYRHEHTAEHCKQKIESCKKYFSTHEQNQPCGDQNTCVCKATNKTKIKNF